MRKLLLSFCFLGSLLSFSQQDVKDLKKKTEKFKIERTERISSYKIEYPKANLKSEERLLWDVMNGKPIYIENYNLKAEKALRTDFLKLNGILRLDLSGEGFTIGLWEVGGIPELLHSEFIDNDSISRIVVRDSSEVETFHATHVAGTLIAKGLNTEAEGMAPGASLDAYNAEDDFNEVIEALENNEIIISNHSYGVPVRNLDGNEWYIGAYSSTSEIWDIIVNFFPYYTPVFAAGNDGNAIYDGGLLENYDKLTGSITSKNTLSVANASSVEIGRRSGDFERAEINLGSSQGPTDDGRIKPDITGLGTSIISSSLESQYRKATGTSMASPNVAGSALLLQELYENLNNEFMLSSSLKGLISVTADDAGLKGPDPKFGWGIMNSKRAAEAIINDGNGDIIKEDSLVSGENHRLRIENSTGKTMKVAIAWNDPAGTSVSDTLNDPTPVLVNDLDIRISNISNEEQYLPWKLDIDDVSAAAKTGDNKVDNIEVIEIDDQGVFDVSITHKSDLKNGGQKYSLIILNGLQQSLSNSEFNSAEISLWPNPVKTNLNITSSEVNFGNDTKVLIYDMLGREVLNQQGFESESNLSIDMSTLSKGIYILNLTDGMQSIQKRIIKE